MSLLVLSESDLRATLDMPSCITAMEEALAGLARGELTMPLRSIVRVPDDDVLGLGLMPAHRGGARPLISLKEVVVVPANPTRGLDPHQGAVLLHDGATGQLVAVLNASTVTEVRTAAVSAVATKLLARPDARQVAILGSGVQGRSHAVAMREVLPSAELRIWSPTPANAEALALEAHGVACASVEEALEGADVVCTCTSSPEPVVVREHLSRLAPGAHLNAVGSSGTWAREIDADVVVAASLFVDRRESALAESGDYLGAVVERGIGPEHITAELGELLVAPSRMGADKELAESGDYLGAVDERGIGPEHITAELGELLVGAHPGRRDETELTLFKSLGLAVEDLAAAEVAIARARALGLGTEVPF